MDYVHVEVLAAVCSQNLPITNHAKSIYLAPREYNCMYIHSTFVCKTSLPHMEAPVAGSVVLLKLGGYGCYRWLGDQYCS